MKALIIDNASETPIMVPGTCDKPEPEPGPNELLVKIEDYSNQPGRSAEESRQLPGT